MSAGSSRTSRARRILRLAGVVAGVLAVLAVAVWIFRHELFGRWVAARIEVALHESLGGTWHVDSVDGGWISDARVSGVRLTAPDDEGRLRIANVDQIEVEFDLLRIAGGARALTAVRVSGLTLDIDLARPGSPDAPTETSPASFGSVLDSLPPALDEIAIDGHVTVRTASGDRVSGRVTALGDVDGLDVSFAELATPVGAESGDWRVRLTRPEPSRLELASSVAFGGVEVRRLSLDLAAKPGARLTGEAAVAGGTVRIDSAAGATRVSASDVDLARLPPWVLDFAGAGEPLAGVANAELDVTDDRRAVLVAHGRGVAIRGVSPFDVDATLDLSRTPVVVSKFSVTSAAFRVTGRDAVVDPGDAWIVVECADVIAETSDLAAVLRELGGDAKLPQGEGPFAARVRLSRDRGAGVRVHEAEVRSPDGAVASVTGDVRLPGTPRAWDDATFDLAGTVRADVAEEASIRRFGTPILGRLDASLRVRGRVAAPRLEIDASLADARIDGRSLGLVRARASFEGGVLDVADLRATVGGGSLAVHGVLDTRTGAVSGAVAEFDVPDVALLLADDAAKDDTEATLRGRLHVKAIGSRRGGTELPSGAAAWLEGVAGTFVASGEDVVIDGLTVRGVNARGRIDGRAVFVESVTAASDAASVEAECQADLLDLRVHGVVARVRLVDASKLPAGWTGGEPVRGSGTAEFRAPTLPSRIAGLDGLDGASASGALVGVAVGSVDFGAVDFEASVAGGRATAAATAMGGAADVAVRGSARSAPDEAVAIRLDEVSAKFGGHSVRLVGTADVRVRGRSVELAAAVLDVDGARVRVSGSAGDDLVVDASASDLGLARFLPGIEGRADVTCSVRGAGPEMQVILDATLAGVRASDDAGAGVAATLHVAAAQSADGLVVEDATLDAGPSGLVRASGRLPWRLGAGGFARASQAEPDATVTVRTSSVAEWALRAGLVGIDATSLDATLRTADGRTHVEVRAPGVTWAPSGRPDAAVACDVTFRADSDATGTTAVLDAAAAAETAVHAEFRVGAGLHAAGTSGTNAAAAMDTFLAAPLAGEIVLTVPDLAAPRPGWRVPADLAGRVSGRVAVSGTLATPELSGTVEAEGVSVGVAGSPLVFDRGAATLTFAGREIRVVRLDGRLGYGTVHAEGTLQLPAGAQPRVELRIRGENVLLAQDDTVRVRADPDLVVTGPLDALAVTGDVRLRDTLVALELEPGAGSASSSSPSSSSPSTSSSSSSPRGEVQFLSLGDGLLGAATLDVRVRSAGTVRIVSERIRGTASLDLRLRGTGAHPEPEGRIEFPGLVVALPFSRLTVRNGTIEFPPDRPFAPRVQIVAECRARGYDLTVRVTGDVPDVDVAVSSVPALTREEALVLLASGASPDDVTRRGVGGIALTRAQSLVAHELISQVSRPADPTERNFLDDLSFETRENEADRGGLSYEASYRLADDVSVRVERDRFLDYVFGVVWRIRFR